MNWIIRKLRKEGLRDVKESDAPFDSVIQPRLQGDRFKLLPWLAAAIFIFALLYCSSYVALLWLPPYAGLDMKSQLVADYSPWTFLAFQPVDPAVIEEIKQERSLPEQVIIDGGLWPTPVGIVTLPPLTVSGAISTPLPTLHNPPTSSATFESPYTSTSIPTSIITVPASTVTPQPNQAATPATTRKPLKTPKTPKHHKTPKP